MSHTKGELKLNSHRTGLAQIDGITLFVVLPNNCETTEQLSRRKVNAKELIRRWNAFEEGGLVGDLRKAADEGLHECERVKINCTCGYKDMASLLRRIERIETAIDKTEQS